MGHQFELLKYSGQTRGNQCLIITLDNLNQILQVVHVTSIKTLNWGFCFILPFTEFMTVLTAKMVLRHFIGDRVASYIRYILAEILREIKSQEPDVAIVFSFLAPEIIAKQAGAELCQAKQSLS